MVEVSRTEAKVSRPYLSHFPQTCWRYRNDCGE